MFSDGVQWFVLDVNPEPWAVGPVGVARSNGAMHAYVGRNQQLDSYKQAVTEELESQSPVKIDGKIEIEFYFWREIITYKNEKDANQRKHEADLTNLQKATEDACQGILFDNDRDVVSIESHIVDQGPGVHGKVVIRVQEFICLEGITFYLPPHIKEQVYALDAPRQMAPDAQAWGDGPAVF